MLQTIVKKGLSIAEEVPAPKIEKGTILISVAYSAISVGTELGKITRTGKSLVKTAMEQPDKVREVLDMVNQRGVSKTIAKIKDVTDTGKLAGYSVSGTVMEVGKDVKKFKVGDRVAAAGADIANHAEYVNVPENLVMHVPDNLDLKFASTVTLGGIALQGVRRAEMKLGEYAVVFGSGILGLLAIQLLKSSGVRVAAIDLDDNRLKLAKEFGAEIVINPDNSDFVTSILNWTNGYGADAILFTAATNDSGPLSQCFKVTKKKGRVVLVGVSGMEINRADIYEKEIDFFISTSYGPGRYDKNYEEKGIDYPYGYVRWTENRNMTEFLRLVATGSINIEKMIDKIFKIDNVDEAFAHIKSDKKPILVLLKYKHTEEKYQDYLKNSLIINLAPIKSKKSGSINIALIGAGNFATGTHLPNLANLNNKFRLHCVMNRSGYKAKVIAERYNAEYATTDYESVLKDKNVDLVFITTQHDSHAALTLSALENNKHVFVEKPLATNKEDLLKIEKFYKSKGDKPLLMVGYNRRFSKYAKEIEAHTSKRVGPLFLHYRMNAGFLPTNHWIFEQGGRIVGEGCHIIDLMTYFTGSEIVSISKNNLQPNKSKYISNDNITFSMSYKDGSVATIEYFAVGSKNLPKESLEIHFDEKSIIMEDYKKLTGYGLNIKSIKSHISEKGLSEELLALYNTISGKEKKWPIELWDLIQTTKATLSLNENY